MFEQLGFGPPPVKSVMVTAHFTSSEGWTAVVTILRDGQTWADSERRHVHARTVDSMLEELGRSIPRHLP